MGRTKKADRPVITSDMSIEEAYRLYEAKDEQEQFMLDVLGFDPRPLPEYSPDWDLLPTEGLIREETFDDGLDNGKVRVYRFDNNYGVHIMQGRNTDGGPDGKFSAIMIRFPEESNDYWQENPAGASGGLDVEKLIEGMEQVRNEPAWR